MFPMGQMRGGGSRGGFRAGGPCSEPWTHEAGVWGSGWVTFPGVQPTPSASPRCTPARKSREAPARSSHREWTCQPPPVPPPDALLLPSHLASCLTSRFASRLLPASDLLPLALTSASCLASCPCLGSPCGAWWSQAAPFTPSVHLPPHKHPEHHLPSPPCAQTPDTAEQGRGGRGSWTWRLYLPGMRARAPPQVWIARHPPSPPTRCPTRVLPAAAVPSLGSQGRALPLLQPVPSSTPDPCQAALICSFRGGHKQGLGASSHPGLGGRHATSSHRCGDACG